jgi:hypothetical protein
MEFVKNIYQTGDLQNGYVFKFTSDNSPIIKLNSTGAPTDLLTKPHVMHVSCRMMLENFGAYNSDPAHFVLQARSDLNSLGGDNRYTGHGVAMGKLFTDKNGDCVRSHIETWFGKEPNPPGSNILIDGTMSPELPDNVELRLDFLSTFAQSGFKYARQIIKPIGQKNFIDTGDVEDNNAQVNMQSQCLAFTTIFNKKTGAPSAGSVRVWNLCVAWYPAGAPIPDMRKI